MSLHGSVIIVQAKKQLSKVQNFSQLYSREFKVMSSSLLKSFIERTTRVEELLPLLKRIDISEIKELIQEHIDDDWNAPEIQTACLSVVPMETLPEAVVQKIVCYDDSFVEHRLVCKEWNEHFNQNRISGFRDYFSERKQHKWEKKTKTISEKGSKKRILVEWRFVTSDEKPHNVVFAHTQDTKPKTRRMLWVDGSEKYSQKSSASSFTINFNRKDVVVVSIDQLAEYQYRLTINNVSFQEARKRWLQKE